jgi:hypothetical protein
MWVGDRFRRMTGGSWRGVGTCDNSAPLLKVSLSVAELTRESPIPAGSARRHGVRMGVRLQTLNLSDTTADGEVSGVVEWPMNRETHQLSQEVTRLVAGQREGQARGSRHRRTVVVSCRRSFAAETR